jgi:hypothetical protein
MNSRAFQRIYQEYISSSAWKNKRDEFICNNRNNNLDKSSGDASRCYECDRCGWNFRDVELEVHHKHYHTFRNEARKDVLVLCKKCHEIEDRTRAREGKIRSEEALDDAQFYGWLNAVYGDDHPTWNLDLDYEYEQFYEWRERKENDW